MDGVARRNQRRSRQPDRDGRRAGNEAAGGAEEHVGTSTANGDQITTQPASSTSTRMQSRTGKTNKRQRVEHDDEADGERLPRSPPVQDARAASQRSRRLRSKDSSEIRAATVAKEGADQRNEHRISTRNANGSRSSTPGKRTARPSNERSEEAQSKGTTAPDAVSSEGETEKSADKKLKAQLAEYKKEKVALQTQLEIQAAAATRLRETITQLHSQCVCTICLELAWRPHVLSPCGHVFCARCLILWFKRPQQAEGAIPQYYTPEQRAEEERQRTLRREKLCPHCREEIFGRPAEVWMVKSIIDTIDESVRQGQGTDELQVSASLDALTEESRNSTRGKDLPSGTALWKDIFDKNKFHRTPIYDVEDRVYRCGVCSSEIINNRCTNPTCRYQYNDDQFPDEVYDGEFDDEMELYNLLHGEEYPDSEDEEWEEDDHDFIDDGPVEVDDESADEYGFRHRSPQGSEDDDEDGGESDVQEVDGRGQPVRRRLRRVIASLSDSEEGGDEDGEAGDDVQLIHPDRRNFSPRHEHLTDSEENDEEDDSDARQAESEYWGETSEGEVDNDEEEQGSEDEAAMEDDLETVSDQYDDDEDDDSDWDEDA